MGLSFKSLPPKLFASTQPTTEVAEKTGLLWLPPIGLHPITGKIDWLSGLQISNLQHSKPATWADGLRKYIIDNQMPLDEQPPFNHSETLLFSLPKGFKSSMGLIMKNSNWKNRDDVYKTYSTVCKQFSSDFFVQSLDFWSSPEVGEIEWVKA